MPCLLGNHGWIFILLSRRGGKRGDAISPVESVGKVFFADGLQGVCQNIFGGIIGRPGELVAGQAAQ